MAFLRTDAMHDYHAALWRVGELWQVEGSRIEATSQYLNGRDQHGGRN